MLKDILNRIAEIYGDNIDDESDRAKVIANVNRAAKELYFSFDIRECLDEGIFNVNVDSQQVALPYYVHDVRGMRWSNSREKISADDARNRYQWNFFDTEIWTLRFRKLKPSPVEREINNESVLKLSIPYANGSSFTVSVAGSTSNSSRFTEEVEFSATDTEKYTVGNYQEPILSITKSAKTKYDVTVKDVEDNTVSIIPNHLLEASYTIYQIYDTENTGLQQNQDAIEVIYKRAFEPLADDYDSYWGVNNYDDCIFWKYSEIKESKDDKMAKIFYAKCNQTFNDVTRHEEAGKKRKFAIKNNRFLKLHYAREIGYRS